MLAYADLSRRDSAKCRQQRLRRSGRGNLRSQVWKYPSLLVRNPPSIKTAGEVTFAITKNCPGCVPRLMARVRATSAS